MGFENHRSFVCYDCIFVFTTHTRFKKRKAFCPNCGDNISVKFYKADRVGGKNNKGVKWKDQELELLDKYIDGEYEAHQVAIMTARTIEGVYNRGWKRRKERGLIE